MCLHVLMKLAQGGGREMIKIMFDAIVFFLFGLYNKTCKKQPNWSLFQVFRQIGDDSDDGDDEGND